MGFYVKESDGFLFTEHIFDNGNLRYLTNNKGDIMNRFVERFFRLVAGAMGIAALTVTYYFVKTVANMPSEDFTLKTVSLVILGSVLILAIIGKSVGLNWL